MAKIAMLENNRTYTQYQKIKPEYVVVHSTATGTEKISRLYSSWNRESAGKSCHGMVDDVEFIQTLPYDCRGWHVGGDGNGVSIGFEICEPKNIAYADAAHSRLDTDRYNPNDPANRADFLKRYVNAVHMAAHMCQQTGIKPDRVLCHAEMRKIGKATNHADVLHWFPLFGQQFTMDAFRADVGAVLAGRKLDKRFDAPANSNGNSPVATGDTAFKVRTDRLPLPIYANPGIASRVNQMLKVPGTFTIVEEQNGFGRLKSGAGWVELAKVQRR